MSTPGRRSRTPRRPCSAGTWTPRYTFYIAQAADVMMCLAYFAVALSVSLLTSRIRRQSEELRSRAAQMTRLYDFSRELARSADAASIVTAASRFVERSAGGACAFLLRGKDSRLEPAATAALPPPFGERQRAVADWVNEHGRRAGFGTDTLPGSDVFCLPVRGGSGTLGVMLFSPAQARTLSIEEESTLESVCASVAISLERDKYQKDMESLRVLDESKRLYETILDSVSHEIRTPITSVLGAASALQDPATWGAEANRKALTGEIQRGAQRLNHVVENLLDMSRMSTGQLALKKELVELSETVEAIVREWASADAIDNPVRVDAPQVVYAAVDARLFRNALANLLDNAHHYSPGGGRIEVSVGKDERGAWALIDVADEGRGIAEGEREKIFQRFYRAARTPAGGVGLGLSIVKGIIEAHGGTVKAMDRAGGPGSVLRIELPLWEDAVQLV